MHAERNSVSFCIILFSVHSFITSYSVLVWGGADSTPCDGRAGRDEMGDMQGGYCSAWACGWVAIVMRGECRCGWAALFDSCGEHWACWTMFEGLTWMSSCCVIYCFAFDVGRRFWSYSWGSVFRPRISRGTWQSSHWISYVHVKWSLRHRYTYVWHMLTGASYYPNPTSRSLRSVSVPPRPTRTAR
jgi:hypothetical protein